MSLDLCLPDRSTCSNDSAGISPTGVSPLHDAQPDIVTRIVRGFDADELRQSFRPGEIDHRLLEPGLFDAHLLRGSTEKLMLGFFRYSLAVALNGAWPKELVTILFAFEVPEGAIAQGQPFRTGAIVVLDGSSGMNIRLPANSACAILIADRVSFESALSGCGAAANCCGAANGVPLRVREPEARRLKGLLRAVLDDAERAGQLLRTSGFSPALGRDVLTSYAKALIAAERPYMKGGSVFDRRNRLVKKAEAYVVERLDQSIHMNTLCREVGASPRALEYAFHAIYGMGAMRYLRTIRLNEARKALSHSDASKPVTVTSVAMDWGFWHLGEFAATYRRLFGESPSETLRKADLRHDGTGGAFVRAPDCV